MIAVALGCRATHDKPVPADTIEADLLDVTVHRLHRLYDGKKYTVTQVVQWHLSRIDRYNGVYGAIETVLRREALADAARQDAEAAQGAAAHGPLWGIPIVIKANTSVKGQITTAGWEGFRRAGHELVAPRDATIVAKFKAAGAIIVGLANMPDLAASDTNRSSSFGRTGNAYDVRFSPGGSSGGVVTAGNASGINDGAAALLIGSKAWGSRHNKKPMARILSAASAGVEPRIMGVGPAYAIPKALERAKLQLKDMDIIEINEAFASQVLGCLKLMNVDFKDPRVNPNGGAIAIGHPLGCSGARLALTVARELQQSGGRYAAVSLCIGVGQGLAVILERMQ